MVSVMYSYPCNLSINPLLVLHFVSVFNLAKWQSEVSSCGWSEASTLPYVWSGICLEALCQGPGVFVVGFGSCHSRAIWTVDWMLYDFLFDLV
jgi:hypothetical protein